MRCRWLDWASRVLARSRCASAIMTTCCSLPLMARGEWTSEAIGIRCCQASFSGWIPRVPMRMALQGLCLGGISGWGCAEPGSTGCMAFWMCSAIRCLRRETVGPSQRRSSGFWMWPEGPTRAAMPQQMLRSPRYSKNWRRRGWDRQQLAQPRRICASQALSKRCRQTRSGTGPSMTWQNAQVSADHSCSAGSGRPQARLRWIFCVRRGLPQANTSCRKPHFRSLTLRRAAAIAILIISPATSAV